MQRVWGAVWAPALQRRGPVRHAQATAHARNALPCLAHAPLPHLPPAPTARRCAPRTPSRLNHRQQLAEAAARHNSQRGIVDPGGEAMAGVREVVGVLEPSCEAYPTTIGGNPK